MVARKALKSFFSDRSGPVRTGIRRLRRAIKNYAAVVMAGRRRHKSKALFIAVTGSSGKSTTTALLAHILEGQGQIFTQLIKNRMAALLQTTRQNLAGFDYVALEAGVQEPGDMKSLARVLQPDIGIVTLVGLEHRSLFKTKEAVAEEKGWIVQEVRHGGFVLLNADDPLVMSMASRTKQRIVTFGRLEDADYRVVSASASFSEGLVVEVAWREGTERLVTGFLAEHFWLSTVAAFAAAVELGVPVETIRQRIAAFQGVRNRCQKYKAEGGPIFILDTVKAPNETLPLAFKMMETVQAPRRRIVLGQISDYAGNPARKYGMAYKAARAVADQVIFVGEHAHRSRATAEDREAGRFLEFATPRQVYDHIKATAVEDEVILLKGSTNLHLERIALGWNEKVECWQPSCGLLIDCNGCGRYGYPYEQNMARRRKRGRPL